MPPPQRKRARTSGAAQCTLDQAWESDKLQEVLTAAKSAHTLAEPILTTITNAVEKHGTISGWIDTLTKTPEMLQFWGRTLHTLFPPQTTRDYLGAQPGGWPDNKLMPVQMWMLSWSEEDGFSLPSNDEMLLMISMVLTAGFVTDPSKPGVEALSVRKGKGQEAPVLLEFITSVETESGGAPLGFAPAFMPGNEDFPKLCIAASLLPLGKRTSSTAFSVSYVAATTFCASSRILPIANPLFSRSLRTLS